MTLLLSILWGAWTAYLAHRFLPGVLPQAWKSFRTLWKHAGREGQEDAWLHSVFAFSIACVLLSFGFGWFWLLLLPWPWIKLYRQVHDRRDELVQNLPFDLELLSVMIASGQDVLHAIQNLCAKERSSRLHTFWMKILGSLALGKGRKEVFFEFREEVDDEAFFELSLLLIQSETHGTELCAPLRNLADRIRQSRFALAEKKAQSTPFLMLIPLMGLIFPVTLILLMGPLLLSFLQL